VSGGWPKDNSRRTTNCHGTSGPAIPLDAGGEAKQEIVNGRRAFMLTTDEQQDADRALDCAESLAP
jgi:hypothetical protein